MTTKPIATIQPVKIDGSWFVVSTDVDGVEVRRRGPFAGAKDAKATAEQLIRAIMEKQPGLRVEGFSLFVAAPQPAPVSDELIEDLARFADHTLDEMAVRRRHQLSDVVWESLGADDALVEKIEARKLARIRSGATKRERAQIEIVDGPTILGSIMRDPNANARHVIDSVKALDTLATGGAEAAAGRGVFEIVINLTGDGSDGEHIERYSKSIDINPQDTDDTAPMIAASKTKDDGGGQGHI